LTVDAFRRLALVAACSAYVLGLVLAARWLGWPAALVVLAGGVLVAFAVTVEAGPSPKDIEERMRPGRSDEQGRPRGFHRIGGGR
jgi:hypothetical protein